MAPVRIANLQTSTELNSDERDRIRNALDRFRAATGIEAEFCIKSPGRVNLIGDHIDYHGFSVIPMAIEKSIVLCLSNSTVLPDKLAELRPQGHVQESANRNQLVLLNANSDEFKTHSCRHSLAYGGSLDQDHKWHNYFLCGYHGLLATRILRVGSDEVFEQAKQFLGPSRAPAPGGDCSLTASQEKLDELDHMIVLIDSDLPPASGLSSSSALVCAAALATHLALEKCQSLRFGGDSGSSGLSSETLAGDCAKFEHLVGTRGGGMDQAVILTAQKGYAKHVSFAPRLTSRNVILPQDVVWLISHCGVSHSKAASCEFNSRVLETKLGAGLIIKRLKPSSALSIDHTITLSQVRDELADLIPSTATLMHLIEERIFRGVPEMSFEELGIQLEMSRAELLDRFRTSEEFISESGLDSKLQLLRRCRHVFEESDRVNQFVEVCETTRDVRRLGELMTESHISLRDNYQCSDPALDSLVDVALRAGALGARLTGAGWGGCTVTLVESSKAQQVIGQLEKVSKFTFRTEPQSGATIFTLS